MNRHGPALTEPLWSRGPALLLETKPIHLPVTAGDRVALPGSGGRERLDRLAGQMKDPPRMIE
jgi:hypothetical protein